ncbi:phage tail fiber protein [Agromyces sp. SYSU T00194]|uniref:phage tail fiber protein n=1 Tax=Agromyces chitinivorans TaxID=3158560 RepID=UPI0033983C4D
MSTVEARNISLRSHFGNDRNTALTVGTFYFALFNGNPEGSGVEPTSTGSYARVAKTNDDTLWGTIGSTDTEVSNGGASGEITWPAATAVWSEAACTHWAIFDNSTGGTLLYSGELADDIVVTGAGDIPRIIGSGLTIVQE